MAELGVTQLTDLIGRTDLLEALPGLTARQAKLDLSGVLATPVAPAGSSLFSQQHNPTFDKGPLNLKMVDDLLEAVENMSGGEFRYDIRNTDRSVGCAPVRRDRQASRQPGHGGRSGQGALQRYRRPEFRRLERGWPLR